MSKLHIVIAVIWAMAGMAWFVGAFTQDDFLRAGLGAVCMGIACLYLEVSVR